MFAELLAYLDYQPNFLRQIPAEIWAAGAALALWHTLLSWHLYRQTRLRSYVWGTVASGFAAVGLALAPVARTVLELVLFPGPLLVAAFLILSLSDARSWYTEEASDKYYLIRHGGIFLRLLGRVPEGFTPERKSPGATLRQGLVMCVVTILFMGFAYFGCRHARAVEAISAREMAIITITVGMASFHALALGFFALLYGRTGK